MPLESRYRVTGTPDSSVAVAGQFWAPRNRPRRVDFSYSAIDGAGLKRILLIMTTTKLSLGAGTMLEDGTYFGVAVWNAAARDYVDVPGVYLTEYEARANGGGAMGARLVRWTVSGGSVTTRRGLR